MTRSQQEDRILDAFRDYEAAVRLEAWTAKSMPEHLPPEVVIAARAVAKDVLTNAGNGLVGALYIQGAICGYVGAAPDGASNSEGKG